MLNKQPIGRPSCGGMSYPAFSGSGTDIKDPTKATDAGNGPITIGSSNIVDRPIGDRFPMMELMIHDLISDSQHSEWVALYSKSSQRR